MAANRRLNVLVSVDLKGLTEVLDENEHMRMNRTWKLNCGGLELFMPVTPSHNLGVQSDAPFEKYMSTLKEYNK